MFGTVPVAANEFGPSTAAPARTGGCPSSDPARFATWCCMQSGNTVPSPTISETPHALLPRMSSSQRCAQAA